MRLLPYASKVVGICQQDCWHMAAMFPAYGSNYTNQEVQAK
jgi:hypothetical protein